MNIYLIVSETIYFINEKLKELKDNITNIITFNLEENTLDEVLEEASYFSMFDDKKCIIVKNAKLFSSSNKGDTNKSREDSEKLLKYLECENKNTRIIFITNKVDSKKKIYNKLKECNHVFNYPNITKTEMKNLLKDIANKQKYQIDDNSLWHIINNSLGNFDLAINELNKIMLYYNKPSKIVYEDVLMLTSKTLEDNNFKLVDSIIARDLESSLKYLNELKILKVEPNIIISLLYREFKLMLMVKIYEDKKVSSNEIMRNLKLADWQLQKIHKNLLSYNISELKNEILNLSNIDYKYKSGLINRDVLLLDYIYEMCE